MCIYTIFLLGSSHLDNQPKLHIFNYYSNFKELPKSRQERYTAVFSCYVVCFVWDKTDTTYTIQKGQPFISLYLYFFFFYFSSIVFIFNNLTSINSAL